MSSSPAGDSPDAMDDVALYNSKITRNYVEYLKTFHPDVNVDEIMQYAGVTSFHLEDSGHWLTQRQVDRFHEMLVRKTGNPNISREAGRLTGFSKASGALPSYVLGFLSPGSVYSMLSKFHPIMTRAATIQTKSLGANRMEAIVTPNPGVTEKPYQCENRIGTFESVGKMFTPNYSRIEHPECVHRGGKRCRYLVTWERTPAYVWQRIRNYLLLALAVTTPVLIHTMPGTSWLTSILSGSVVALAAAWYTEFLERRRLAENIKSESELAGRLLDEINIRYNNALLIHEIGQATSMILHIEDLLKYLIDALRKRLDFDRGMILLANRELTRLTYKIGYGYGEEDEAYLKTVNFNLTNPESRGVMVVAFRKQTPFLVDNVDTIEKDLSKKSLDFAHRMGAQSFICVPIVFEQESMGILLVDNVRSKRNLSQSDMNLLMGLARHIGISINNARIYARIRESEEKFRSLSESAPDIIFTLDDKGAISYVNPAWEKILGYPPDEVIGRHFARFAKPEEHSRMISLFKRIRKERTTVRQEIGIMLHRDGSERYFLGSAAPNVDSEGRFTVVGMLRNVTEQRQLELKLHHASKMEAVGTLTGGISHDFNNIMQAISGYNQLLMMKRRESDPDWKHLTSIDKLVQRASDLIKQLLIFSRKMESKLKAVDLNEEVLRFHDLIVQTIPRMITVETDLEEGLYVIQADPVQLGQIIMNLAVNARDAMPEGGILRIQTANVRIDLEMKIGGLALPPGKYVQLTVSDTGTGMTKEVLEHIFEPFFTTKEAGKGTGLGLSVVYGIVRNHGGTIVCASEPRGGTVFQIYLPAWSPVESPAATVPAALEEPTAKGSETILLVDDETHLLETGKDILEEYGYKTLLAQDGETALDRYRRNMGEIDLIILDLIMPGMGGIKCLSELVALNPNVRVIVASGYSASVKEKEVRRMGARGFINKPYKIQELLRMIRSILDES